MLRYWCLDSKKGFLFKGELEVLNFEDFECYGVAFLYGSAFFHIHVRELLFLGTAFLTVHSGKFDPASAARYICDYQHSCILSQRFLLLE